MLCTSIIYMFLVLVSAHAFLVKPSCGIDIGVFYLGERAEDDGHINRQLDIQATITNIGGMSTQRAITAGFVQVIIDKKAQQSGDGWHAEITSDVSG